MPTVLITGANRGLGLEFARQYADEGWSVIATCRDPSAATELADVACVNDRMEVRALDVADLGAVDALADDLGNRPIDVLLLNAGVFGPKRQANNDLRQSFGHIDYDILESILHVNAVAPLKLAERFAKNVASSEQKKIVAISSTLGSITEGEPGLYAYRTSKAALNMLMATVARDLAEEGVIVTVFCPGWVKTDMGGPDASLDATESIGRLRELVATLTAADSGAFISQDGRRIPW